MFKRFILISALVLSAVAVSGTRANAQFFDGWGWFGFSEVTGVIDLSKVPNPDSKPSIVTVNGSLNFIEVICKNPADNNVAPGNAGSRIVATANAIGNDEITDRKSGKATITVKFGADALADAEATATCVNLNWSVVAGSAAPKQMSLTLKSFRCIPESKTDPEPCVNDVFGDGNTLTVGANPDTLNLTCTIDPILRNADGIPLHEQTITCVEV